MHATKPEALAGNKTRGDTVRKLLVFDMSYTFEMIRQRKQERSVTCRDLDGFFDHVWTVHPFATLLTSFDWAPREGRAQTHDLAPRHSFIEGKVGHFSWLAGFPIVNFALSQCALFIGLLRLIKTERITAIRAGDPHYLGLFGLMLARLAGIPLVLRIGGNYDLNRQASGRPIYPRLFRSARIEKALERFVLSRADLVAGANQDNLDFALANGARPALTTLFRYGNLIDERHFVDPAKRPAASAGLDRLGLERGKILLTVARLEANNSLKHPGDVVRVLASVRSRGHDVKAVFAGEGPMRQELFNLARELGVADHLLLPGSQDQGWLAEMLPQAAAVVSPHGGRALSEAALAGAPVVAYDIDWQRELIETDRTGILVPNRAWQDMADGVSRFLSDPAYAQRLGAALRQKALAMLDPRTLDAHEKLEYLRLLARFDAPGRPESARSL